MQPDFIISPTTGSGFFSTTLVAMLNARRYHGLETITPYDKEHWERLVDHADCRLKEMSLLDYNKVSRTLGLHLIETFNSYYTISKHLPIMLEVSSPANNALRLVLVVEAQSNHLSLVNYRGKLGVARELVSYEEIITKHDPKRAWQLLKNESLN